MNETKVELFGKSNELYFYRCKKKKKKEEEAYEENEHCAYCDTLRKPGLCSGLFCCFESVQSYRPLIEMAQIKELKTFVG